MDYGAILRLVQAQNALDATNLLCHSLAMKNTRTEIKAWMRENRVKQYELAKDVGIRAEQMSRILSHKKTMVPSPPVRRLLFLLTGLPVADEGAWK